MGVTPVLSATVGDGEVDLSWTDWNPPPDPWEDAATVIDYRWRMKVEGGDWSDWTYVDGTSTTVPGLENGKAPYVRGGRPPAGCVFGDTRG